MALFLLGASETSAINELQAPFRAVINLGYSGALGGGLLDLFHLGWSKRIHEYVVRKN